MAEREEALQSSSGSYGSEAEPEKDTAYEYLCRLEEAKKWLESVLVESLPPVTQLEDRLQNGVVLCKLGMRLLPLDSMWNKVYDLEEKRYKSKGLDYRHTDNINFWLASLQKLGLPKVFYPDVTDIYHKKNMPKLIYCLHALSHLLRRQGKVSQAVDDLYGTAKFSRDDLVQASETLKSHDMPAFGVVENLVEEELQYQALGMSDGFDEEASTISPPNSPTNPSPNSEPLFDDPKYVSASDIAIQTKVNGNSQDSHTPFAIVACRDGNIRASLYSRRNKKDTKSPASPLERAVQNVNKALENGDPQELMEALQKSDGTFPFVFQEAKKYHAALLKEREQGLPKHVLPVFSGINRETCENLLEKMSPGAYIVRDSRTVQGAYVFSFRNQTGIKHWKLSTKDGKFYWGMSPLYETLDAFVEHFVDALSQVTKLHVYTGMTTALQPTFQTTQHQSIINSLRQTDGGLTYGRICKVIKDVNSEIRLGRKFSSDCLPVMTSQVPKWNNSMIVKINRLEAENTLNKEGQPGSYLVRPSEKTPGDYALAFRTKSEVRHWKIVHDKDKFYVHPRPNPYDSLDDIVKHFSEAVSLETGLTMVPFDLSLGKEEVKDFLAPLENSSPSGDLRRSARSSTIGRTANPTASLSKLNPANITSWTVDDVCQWLCGEGLGRFADIFKENAVDGECLLTLDNNLLKNDLEITALGHRSRIMKRLQKLKESTHPHLS